MSISFAFVELLLYVVIAPEFYELKSLFVAPNRCHVRALSDPRIRSQECGMGY